MEQQQFHGWQIIAEVYNHDEAYFLTGLLNSVEIPVKMERETLGNIYGLTVGPLATIKILVPCERADDAQKLLAEQNEEDKQNKDEAEP